MKKVLENRLPNVGELFIVNNKNFNSFIRVETNSQNVRGAAKTWESSSYACVYADNWNNRNYFIYGRELSTGNLYRFCSVAHGSYGECEFSVFGNGYPKLVQEIQLAMGGAIKDVAILILTGQTYVGKDFGVGGEFVASNGVVLISEPQTSPHYCNADRIYVMNYTNIAGTIALPAKQLDRVIEAINEFNENFS